MKLEPFESDFEKFTDLASYHYLDDQGWQSKIKASGIDLPSIERSMNGMFEGLYLVKDYEALRKKGKSHEDAAFEIEDHISRLRLKTKEYGFFPTNPSRIRKIYNRIQGKQKYAELGEKLQAFPDNGQEILAEFDMRHAKSVDFEELSQMVGREYLDHFEASIDGDQRVIIPEFEKTSIMIGGFNGQRIGVITGQTGYGKTNFALNLVLAGLDKMNVFYFNMEMGMSDISRRFAGIIKRVTPSKYYDPSEFQNGKVPFNPHDVVDFIQRKPNKLFITTGESLSLDQIESLIRIQSIENDTKMFIIDYDQKLKLETSAHKPEWKALQEAIERLEDIAKERHVHIIVMAQKNQTGNISGSYRSIFPAHYHLDFNEHEIHGAVLEVKTKNRHGKQGVAIKCKYEPELSRVSEVSFLSREQMKEEQKFERPTPKPKKSFFGGNYAPNN